VRGTATPDNLTARVRATLRGVAFGTWLEIFVCFNFFCLTGDVLLAHSENHFRNPAEYIPFVFSLAATALLAAALVPFLRFRRTNAWRYVGFLIGWLSILVGIAGVLYHLDSNFFYARTLKSLTYAAPFVAPLAYTGLGCLLIMNRMVHEHDKEWPQWVLFFTLGGFAGNFALSLADHATNGFFRWSEWIPVISSAVAVGFLLVFLLAEPADILLKWSCAVLVLQIAVGIAGFFLHALADLNGLSSDQFENVISGAPPFAPLLLPNLAILGFIGLLASQTAQREARTGTPASSV
jgi:hypothetical protein